MRRSLLILALTILSGCAHREKDSTVRIAVGGQSQLVYLPATLAGQLHLYEKEGLKVALSDFPGGSKALEALLGGSADVVCGYFDHVIQLNAEGRHLKAFVTMQRFPGLALVVSPAASRKVNTLADLRGAVVGVSAPGSSTDLLLKYLLSGNGVDPGSVSVTGIGMSAGSVAAMEHGKVDAAIMADPAITILEKRTGHPLVLLADTRTEEGVKQVFGTTQYPAAVLYSTGEWIARNPGAVARLTRAIRQTLAFIQSSPGEVAARMPASFQGDDPSLYEQTVRAALPMYSVDGRMPADGPEIVRKVLSVSLPKVREASFDSNATFVWKSAE
ncbi:MAG: ABC transporter substrate-binding protein [Bryobacterales bacterium]|nr:ABC transporter substrate-binding protein [Bryobacterales bacterium]